MKHCSVLIILVFGFALSVNSEPQQHAPTVAMCRADVALWYNSEMATAYLNAETLHITDNVKNLTPTAKLPLTEVLDRTTEMGDCTRVEEQHSDTYVEAQRLYSTVRGDRVSSFIYRHHLMAQLRREDSEGIR